MEGTYPIAAAARSVPDLVEIAIDSCR
jgi:hypothetical protein